MSDAINCAQLSFRGLKSPKLLCASECKVSDKIILLNKAKGKVAGFGILKIFLQLFCWGAVVPLCVATRTWYLAHLTAGDFLAALWKFIQNTTQSTGFWKTPVHKHTEDFLMPSCGRVTKAPSLRAETDVLFSDSSWSTLSRYWPICLVPLPYLRCHGSLSERSSSMFR